MRRIWSYLGVLGTTRRPRATSGNRVCTGFFGASWARMAIHLSTASRFLKRHLKLLEATWGYVRLPEADWCYLGLAWATWGDL